ESRGQFVSGARAQVMYVINENDLVHFQPRFNFIHGRRHSKDLSEDLRYRACLSVVAPIETQNVIVSEAKRRERTCRDCGLAAARWSDESHVLALGGQRPLELLTDAGGYVGHFR